MAGLTQNLKLIIDADNKASGQLKNLQKDANDTFGNESTGSSKGLGALGNVAAVGMAAAAAAVVAVGAGLVASVGKAAEFEAKMSKVKAVTQASAEDFDRLSTLARKMGSETAFSAAEAADGITFLGQAGFSTDQIFQALPATLNLAAAGGLELAEAADIASNVLSGMRLEASETARVTDVLAQASASSNTNVQQLGNAFAMVAPGAAAAGVSLNDTATALGVLADNGIQASSGGTALNAALRTMLKPSKDAEEAAQRLGVSFVNTEGKIKPLNEIIADLETANISAKDALVIFGEEGGRAINALVGSGSKRFDELKGKIEGSDGAAAQMALTMNDNFAGSMKVLGSATDELMITVGELFLPLLKSLLDGVIVPGVMKITQFTRVMVGAGSAISSMATEAVGWVRSAGNFIMGTENAAESTKKLKKETAELNDEYKIVKGSMFSTSSTFQILTQKEDEAAKKTEKLKDETKKLADFHQRNFKPALKSSTEGAFELSGAVDDVGGSLSGLPAKAMTGTGGLLRAFNDTMKNPNGGLSSIMSDGFSAVLKGGKLVGTLATLGSSMGAMIGGPLGSVVTMGLGKVMSTVSGLFSRKGKADQRQDALADLQGAIGQGDIRKFSSSSGLLSTLENAGSAKLTLDAFTSVLGIGEQDASSLIKLLAVSGLKDRPEYSAEVNRFNEILGASKNKAGFSLAQGLVGAGLNVDRSAASDDNVTITDEAETVVRGGTAGGSIADRGAAGYLRSAFLDQKISRGRVRELGAAAVAAAVELIGGPFLSMRSGLLDIANGGTPDLMPFSAQGIDIVAGAGGRFVASKPTTVMFGEQGAEEMTVRRLDGQGYQGSGGGNNHFTFNVNALDPRSFAQWLERDGKQVIISMLRSESQRGREMIFNSGLIAAPTV